MKIFNNIASYITNVTELIWHFIKHPELYPQNAMLAVQPELMATVIDNPKECKHCDFYAPRLLMTRDSKGRLCPDMAAIRNLATRYF